MVQETELWNDCRAAAGLSSHENSGAVIDEWDYNDIEDRNNDQDATQASRMTNASCLAMMRQVRSYLESKNIDEGKFTSKVS